MILPDVLEPGLALVLCGTAPSRVSKELGAYYAHPGNIFWQTLYDVGLTPLQLSPSAYSAIVAHGIGLTDLNKTEWGADSELSRDAFDVAAFEAKIRAFRPGAVAFTSKFAARTYLKRDIPRYGLQAETIDLIPLHVMPSTSGRARRYFDIELWRDLATSMGLGR